MNNISCDVCMDLMPLVKDRVASDDSCQLVVSHIAQCAHCCTIYDQLQEIPPCMNEGRVLSKIRRQLFFITMGILILGTVFGLALSNSMGMFYNILIMPILGALGYFALKSKFWLVPVGIVFLSYFWLLVIYIKDGMLAEGFTLSLLAAPLFFTGIYFLLSLLGAGIGALLKYAFRKGD